MSPRVRELEIHYRPHRSGAVHQGSVATPARAAAVLVPMLEHQPDEHALVLLLTTKYQLIAVHQCAKGSLQGVEFDPRTVYRAALLANAAAVILAHNHPSGDCHPSPEDIAITRRLVDAGQLLGVQVLDHMIIGDRCYCSLKEQGIL